MILPEGIIRSVVSVSVYYFAAGLLVPGGFIRPVVSVSVYYFAAGLYTDYWADDTPGD
jgi:hypothetical protein